MEGFSDMSIVIKPLEPKMCIITYGWNPQGIVIYAMAPGLFPHICCTPQSNV